MRPVAVSTPFNIDLEFEIAPFHKRLLAWFADIIVLMVYAKGMKLFLEQVFFDNARNYPVGIDLVLVSLPMLFYHLVMEAVFQGQSLGKKITGIRVISLQGGEPNIGQYLIRWAFRIWEWPLVFGFVNINSYALLATLLVCCGCGLFVVIIIAVTQHSQRFGDLAAGTTVVLRRSVYSLADTVFQHVGAQDYQVMFPEVMKLSDRDINAIKAVLEHAHSSRKFETAYRVADKVKQVLQVQSDMDVTVFLERLLADYNYLATRE